MSITINDNITGSELEIDLNAHPDRFNVNGLHTKEERDSYQGPLGDVYFRDGEHGPTTPSIHTAFEDLGGDVQKELTEIEQEVRKLMDRARALLGRHSLLEPELMT